MALSAKINWLNDGFAPFLGKVQSHHVFDFCCEYVERADNTVISSFAINEAFVRRLIKNREALGKLTLIWDSNMAVQNISKLFFAAGTCDSLYLANNHSKIIFMAGSGKECVAVSSVNTTGNFRYEGGLVIRDPELVSFYKSKIDELILDSKPWTNWKK